jgi:hypothetical protein
VSKKSSKFTAAAPALAKRVFTPTGKDSVFGFEFKKAKTPVFAAVSPKRDKGP